MPSVSITNAFDITKLDVDVSLTLASFSDSCNGTYTKTDDKTWTLAGNTREIVYVNDAFTSPQKGDVSRWEIRIPSTPTTIYFVEDSTSAAGHPLDVVWSNGSFASPLNSPLDAIGTTVGTVVIVANQDIGGTLDIRDFTNLTSLNAGYFGLTEIKGDIYDKDLTSVNLSGNSIDRQMEKFAVGGVIEEFLIRDSKFHGYFRNFPSTLKYIDISNNNIGGIIPTLAGHTNLEKFIANQSDPYDSPLDSPESITQKSGILTGRLPTLEGCTNLTHFHVSGNDLNFMDLDYRIPPSIISFDISNNNLFFGIIFFVLKAFNETFHESSPQIDVSGEGRVIDISNNRYDANDSPDQDSDNSPMDDDIVEFKTNLESLGWTVTL